MKKKQIRLIGATITSSATLEKGETIVIGGAEYQVVAIKPTSEPFVNTVTVKILRKAKKWRPFSETKRLCVKCGARVWGIPIRQQCQLCATTVEPTIPNLIKWLKMLERDARKNIKIVERKLRKQMGSKLTTRDLYWRKRGEHSMTEEILRYFDNIEATESNSHVVIDGFDFAKLPLKPKKLKASDYRAAMITMSAKDFRDQDKLIKLTRLLFRALILTMLRGGFRKRGKKYIAITVSDKPIRRAGKRGK